MPRPRGQKAHLARLGRDDHALLRGAIPVALAATAVRFRESANAPALAAAA